MSVGALIGCNDDDATACANDQACERGQICEDDACVVVDCNYLGDCPGSGRTCLYDLDQCSAKECDGAIEGQEVFCSAPTTECITGGGWRSACIAPGTFECSSAADCESAFGEGVGCCDGFCGADCGGGTGGAGGGGLPVGDMGGLPTVDQGVEADMGAVVPDQGVPVGDARLCSPCGNNAECAALGDGALCTAIGGAGSFCTSACDPAADACPAGFQCVQGFDQCLPIIFECTGCLAEDCPGGQVCDVSTGACQQPQGVCGSCADDAGCVDGLTCGAHEGRDSCFAACEAGNCDAGYACVDGLCKPEAGPCDACGGLCGDATPFCNEDSGQCQQCGAGAPCEAGLTCDLASHNCVDNGPACLSDIDCQAPDASVCFNGQCVACLDDSQCPGRHACNENFQCIPAPCGGVTCQNGSVCDAGTGRCEVGCNTNMDCAVPAEMECNAATGQCFYSDFSCDLAGSDAVCAPGSACVPGLVTLGNASRGNCSCVLEDPANALSAPIVGCHPGAVCFYLEQLGLPPAMPPAPGSCSASLF
jgi:hypothetical protein